MLTKKEFEIHLKWELATMVKVVTAVPEENYDYRPHERSRSAKELIRSLISEVGMTTSFIKGQSVTPENAGSFYDGIQAETVQQAAQEMTVKNNELLSALESLDDSGLKTPVKFFFRETVADDAIFNMMLDLIHHRGQLSVYVRLAGGKVPSIYGPSADEEFTG